MTTRRRMHPIVQILITLSLLIMPLLSVAPAIGQSPADVARDDASRDADSLAAETVAPTLVDGAPGVSETGLYIVRLHEPSLASYEGGIPSLAPTSPRVTGEPRLDVEAADSVAYLSYLETQQQSAVAAVESTLARSVDVAFQYLNVLNAFAVSLTPDEAARVAALPGVMAVYPDILRELTTDVGPALMGAPIFWDGAWDLGAHRGEGVVVGMLDTGINPFHASFSAIDGNGYHHTNPFGSGNYVGVCDAGEATQTYDNICNDKLIGAWSLINGPNSGNSARDWNDHGSHVASTIAGNLHDAPVVVGTQTFTRTISGVAPSANIISYQVCDPSCPGSSSVAAVNQAIADGVDVLNYSISGGDSPWTDLVDLAFLDAYAAGVFVSASAGNNGPGASTVAKTGPWNASVAASTHNRVIANTVDVTAPTQPPALQGLAAVPGSGPAILSNVSGGLIWAGSVNSNNVRGCNQFPGNPFAGAIALIERGDCTFATKLNNAVAAGAVAMIAYNHVGGPPITMGGMEATSSPAVFVDRADGQALAEFSVVNPGAQVRINASASVVVNDDWQDIMAGFSSRGPSQWDLLKPDYAAPGVNILAAGHDGSGDYVFMQGTSMSSPHAAGAAALMVQRHPDWTPAEIKSALSLSATPTLLDDDGVNPANNYAMGSGRIDLQQAAQVGLVLDESVANYMAANPASGGSPRDLNQPSMVDLDCVGECSWTRTVKSVLYVPVEYQVSTYGPAGMEISVTPSSFTIAAGGTQVLQITADVSALPLGTHAFGGIRITPAVPAASASVLLSESFASDTFPPAGWSRHKLQGAGTTTWVRDTAQSNIVPASARRIWANTQDGFQDDWLVTPGLNLTAGLDLRFADRGQWMNDYVYSGVWISTESCSPADGDFVELREINDSLNNAWRQVPPIGLGAYAGQTACLAFRYSGTFGHTWWVDDVVVDLSGDPGIAGHRLPVIVLPAADPVEPTPAIQLSPSALEARIAEEEQTSLTLDIGNVGSADLVWSLDTAPSAASVPASLGLPVGADRASGAATTGAAAAPAVILPAQLPPSFYAWSEGFDNIGLLPGKGWGLINNSEPLGLTSWFQGNSVVFPAHEGAVDAYIGANFNNTAGVGIISNWLLTPETLMRNGDQFSFYTRAPAGSSWSDRLEVRLSTSGASTDVGATATSVGVFGTLLLEINPALQQGGYPAEWTQYTITLSGLPGPTSGRLAFRYFVTNGGPSGANSDYIGIDTVEYGAAVAGVLYDNGPLVNSPGTGPGGADESVVQNVSLGMSTFGFGVQLVSGDANRIADDFGVETPGGWTIDEIVFYGYQTGSTLDSSFTAVNYRIWDGPPNVPGSAIIYGDTTTNRMVGTGWTGTYRVAENSLGNTQRPIMYVVAEASVHLDPGTYWLDWQLAGSVASGPWQPPITINGQTTTGNALQLVSTGWEPLVDTGTATPQGVPFILLGGTVCDAPGDVSWLSATPMSGTTEPGGTDSVTVTLNATGMAEGDHTAYLCVFSNDPTKPAVPVPVVMTVYSMQRTYLPIAIR